MTADAPTKDATWTPVAANDVEAWALAAGAVGWVDREPLDAVALLRAEVQALESRRAALEEEIRDARTEGFAAGVAEGIASLKPWMNKVESEVAGLTVKLRDRAVDTALVIAEVIVREEVQANRLTISQVVARTLADHSAPPTRILVAPTAVTELKNTLSEGGIQSTIVVAADPTLDDGDAIIAYPDGQIDARISTLIQAFRADVVTELNHD